MPYIAFRVASQVAPPPGSPHTALIERNAAHTERSFTYYSLLVPTNAHILLIQRVPKKMYTYFKKKKTVLKL